MFILLLLFLELSLFYSVIIVTLISTR